MAQNYAARLISSCSSKDTHHSLSEYYSINPNDMKLIRPRRVGIEHLALHAISQLKLEQKLKTLGFNQPQMAAALGNIVARMASPASELATHHWLQQVSGLGELMGYHYEDMPLERLYRISDQLWKHREALEKHLYEQERSLFGFEETITLYDLTNTFFEGTALTNPKAKFGRSKEKRSDCPLVTLGLVLDGSGFPRKSEIFAGNVSEGDTLKDMLTGLNATPDAMIIMDAGIATETNIQWLSDQGYRYLVVSRQRHRNFDEDQAITVKETAGQQVRVQRIHNQETGEVELYCHSELRMKKEQAIQNHFSTRFEDALQGIANGLHKKGYTKRYDKVLERIGRLKQKYARAAQHYTITVTRDPSSELAISIDWKRQEKENTQATHPGVYCLRTNETQWKEARLWKTYTLLTDLEGVFRSLKSELGMRPIYHRQEERVSGHIFITLLAYHLVQTLRLTLKSQGIPDSWQTVRTKMENQQRVTATFNCEDGEALHVRKSTQPEPEQIEIYQALGLDSLPGGIQKTVVK
jgi:transposase